MGLSDCVLCQVASYGTASHISCFLVATFILMADSVQKLMQAEEHPGTMKHCPPIFLGRDALLTSQIATTPAEFPFT